MEKWTIKKLEATPSNKDEILEVKMEKEKAITDETDFMDIEDIDKAHKIIEGRLGKLKKEGKLHMCSTPSEEDIGFSMLIRERLNEKEFWHWVLTWKTEEQVTAEKEKWNDEKKHINAICEEAEKWDKKRKKEEVFKINQIVRTLAGEE